jgi:hypothetical protein
MLKVDCVWCICLFRDIFITKRSLPLGLLGPIYFPILPFQALPWQVLEWERGRKGGKPAVSGIRLEDGTHNLCPFILRTQMLNSAAAAIHLINQFGKASALKSITLNQE